MGVSIKREVWIQWYDKDLQVSARMRVKCCDKNEQSSVQKIDSKLFQSELIHSRVQEKLNWFHITITPHNNS